MPERENQRLAREAQEQSQGSKNHLAPLFQDLGLKFTIWGGNFVPNQTPEIAPEGHRPEMLCTKLCTGYVRAMNGAVLGAWFVSEIPF